jgi:hypothetical protein
MVIMVRRCSLGSDAGRRIEYEDADLSAIKCSSKLSLQVKPPRKYQ